jgi:CSLREA domain-containing protein
MEQMAKNGFGKAAWAGRVGVIFVALAAILTVTLPEGPAQAATLTVNTTSDAVDANLGNGLCATAAGTCTLRAAVQEANATAEVNDVIEVPAGIYTLTIAGSGGAEAGDLDVLDSIFVHGAGSGATVIDGNGASRVFEIGQSGTALDPIVNMDNLTIRNGTESFGYGGGVMVAEPASLGLHNAVVRDNESQQFGAGIHNRGWLQLTRSTVRDNSISTGLTGGGQTSTGGGIFNWQTGFVTISDSTISGNIANRGGGINNQGGRVEISNSTISGNRVYGAGGGIRNVDNFSFNGTISINASTITNNEANRPGSTEPDDYGQDPNFGGRAGGGIYNGNGGYVFMGNTILAGNTNNRSRFSPASQPYAPDCFSITAPAEFTSERNNLVGVLNQYCNLNDPIWDNLPFDLVGTPETPLDPRLAPLGDNGGPAQTHALLSGSPAIDAGPTATGGDFFFDCPPTDQRGGLRPQDGDTDGTAACDIGSYEYGDDVFAPEVRPPVQNFVLNSTLGTSTVPVRVTWSATDNPGGSGVARYELQRREPSSGSDFVDVQLPSPTATSITQPLQPNFLWYYYRVRAQDLSGNWSEWSYGQPFTLDPRQENGTGVGYPSGSWATQSISGAYGGAVRYSSANGARASLAFTGRNVAWVAPKGPNRGRAEVWLDGTRVATVDLYSRTAQARRVVFARAVDPSRSHTLEVRVLGTKNASSTGRRVDIDAFVVLRYPNATTGG